MTDAASGGRRRVRDVRGSVGSTIPHRMREVKNAKREIAKRIPTGHAEHQKCRTNSPPPTTFLSSSSAVPQRNNQPDAGKQLQNRGATVKTRKNSTSINRAVSPTAASPAARTA